MVNQEDLMKHVYIIIAIARATKLMKIINKLIIDVETINK